MWSVKTSCCCDDLLAYHIIKFNVDKMSWKIPLVSVTSTSIYITARIAISLVSVIWRVVADNIRLLHVDDVAVGKTSSLAFTTAASSRWFIVQLLFGSKLGFSRILDSLTARFGGVHAFGYNSTRPPKVKRFGWNLEQSEYIVGGWPW